VPLLQKWADEGREVHGKRFSQQEVEEAVALAWKATPAAFAERPSLVPTPARATPRGMTARRAPSEAELLQHAGSSSSLGQGQEGTDVDVKALSVRGARLEVRAWPARLLGTEVQAGGEAQGAGHPPRKRLRTEPAAAREDEAEGPETPETGLFGIPRLLRSSTVPHQTLRISAGRAAAAAGIHPYTDVGDMFLEFVYQDLPDLLLRDAELAGVEVVSPVVERARLLAKSGKAKALEAAVRTGAEATWIEGARAAQTLVSNLVSGAEQAGQLTPEEGSDLRQALELEVNLGFGARHEDAAIEAYASQVGHQVYGQQRRVSIALPEAGPSAALAHTFPPPRCDPLPSSDCKTGPRDESAEPAYFRLTGFVDGLVDLPEESSGKAGQRAPARMRTLVVEVKHRMKTIKHPPNIYDVVQLCSYCRVFGLSCGHLVQCLREESAGGPVGRLHVSSLDFSPGSRDRQGWDEHVLPALYKLSAAVYATRADEGARLQLLAAQSQEERAALVEGICSHLGR